MLIFVNGANVIVGQFDENYLVCEVNKLAIVDYIFVQMCSHSSV